MRLLSCHVENFGRLHDFSLDFCDGCNTVFEANGFGKSTLAAFIRVMFYGFLGETKRKGMENERKRFEPWQGGTYGGSLDFSVGNRKYRMTRIFHDKQPNDEFELRDLTTNLISNDYTEQIGEELFAVNQESFIRTVFIGQNDLVTSATDDINAKIGNLTDDTNDLNRFEEADKKLSDYLNALSPRRKTGIVYKLKAEASDLQTRLRALDGMEEAIEKQQDLIEDKLREIDKLKKQQSEIFQKQEQLSRQKDLQSKQDMYSHLCREMKEKELLFETEKQKLEEDFPKEAELEEAFLKQKKAKDIMADVERNKLKSDEQSRLEELKGRFDKDEDPKGRITAMLGEWNRRMAKKSTISMRKGTFATFRATQEAEAERDKKHAANSMMICMAAGILSVVVGILLLRVLLPLGIALTVAGILLGYMGLRKRKESSKQTEMSDELKQMEQEILSDEAQIKAVDTKLLAYFNKKGISLTDPLEEQAVSDRLQQLLAEAMEYEALLAKEKQALSYTGQMDLYESLQNELTAFLASYGRNVDNSACENELNVLREQFFTARTRADAAKRNYQACRLKKETFEEQNPMVHPAENGNEETAGIQESLENLNREFRTNSERLESLHQTVREYQNRQDELRDRYDMHEELEKQWEDLNCQIEEKTRLYKQLTRTQEFLRQAKENMTQKYVAPLKNSFLHYYGLVAGKDERQYYMDANAAVTIMECGKQRETGYLSTGYQDLIGLCLRLAFADAMYPDEKPVLILDDPLVALDEEKLSGGKRLLLEVAKNYQLIYFTCHETRAT